MNDLFPESSGGMRMTIKVTTVAYILAALIVALGLANLLLHLGRLELGWGQSFGLRRQFNLGAESNIPTLYAAAALLLAATLLSIITKLKFDQRDRFRVAWLGLAVGFLFLAIDESTMIHENIYKIPRALGLDSIGALYWMLPYAVAFALLGAAYWRFLKHLEPRYRRLFLLSAVLFVGGAVGMEASGDYLTAVYGNTANWPRILAMTAEELLEMAGVAVFIVALLRYMEEKIGSISVSLRGGSQ